MRQQQLTTTKHFHVSPYCCLHAGHSISFFSVRCLVTGVFSRRIHTLRWLFGIVQSGHKVGEKTPSVFQAFESHKLTFA